MKNEFNTTTTTTKAVLLLPAHTESRAHRIAEATKRHQISTAGIWTVEANGAIMPPIHRQSGEQLYITADRAVFFALRAREEKSGADLFRELAQSAKADKTRRELDRIAGEAIEAQKEHDRQRATAEAYTAIFKSAKVSPTERLKAHELAQSAKDRANKALSRAKELEAVISGGSASDREQLVQVAILASLDPICAEKPAEAFRHMTNSAGRAVADLASPDALRSTRTKLMLLTAEEARRELEAHPNIEAIDPYTGEEISAPAKIPFNVKGGMAAGYYTIEHREATKTRPQGWYRVNHYHTEAPYMSFEIFASGESAEPIAKNDGVNLIDSMGALEELEALIERANLSEREEAVIKKLTDNTARGHAERAHHEAKERGRERIASADPKHRKRTEKRVNEEAERAYCDELWNSAFLRAGIYAKTTRREMKARIVARLESAKSAPAEQTPAELEARERRAWESLQRNSHRQSAPIQTARPDVLGAWLTLAESIPAHKPVIRWTESNPTEGATWTATAPAVTLSQSGESATAPARSAREQAELDKVSARLADFEAKYARMIEAYPDEARHLDPKRGALEALEIRLKIEALESSKK